MVRMGSCGHWLARIISVVVFGYVSLEAQGPSWRRADGRTRPLAGCVMHGRPCFSGHG